MHCKSWACIKPDGDGCDGEHCQDEIVRLREANAKLVAELSRKTLIQLERIIEERDSLHSEITRLRGQVSEAVENLQEMVDIVDGISRGEYEADSFTCQPAKIFLEKLK